MAKRKGKNLRPRQEEEELERSFRSLAPSQGKEQKQRKSHPKLAIFAISLALVAIITAVVAGYYYFSDANLDGIILENVTVAGVDVGGMSQRDAISAVKAATFDTFGVKVMTVTVLDEQVEIPAECCKDLDVREAVRAAYRFGNIGSKSKRQAQQDKARTDGYNVDIIPYLTIDEETIKAKLDIVGKKYSTTLQQTTYEVTGEYPEQLLVVKLGVPEYGLDMQALYQQVLQTYNQNAFSTEGQCGIITPDEIDLKAIWDTYYTGPVDARFDKSFKIIEGQDGYGFDLEAANKAIENAQYGSTVEIPFFAIPRKVTPEKLKKTLYRDKLASYTAAYGSNSNRDINLTLACKAINGKVLIPGESFSYNETLGERTTDRGYRTGASYVSGEVVDTVGGGICQVSSALYYCVLLSDLEVLTRENHVYASSYVPMGMDATVSWNTLDFCFRNNSTHPIRIEANSDGGNVTVAIYGTDKRDYYVKMEYEVLSTTKPKTTYKTMAPDNAEGYKDGDVIVSPTTGYHVKTYRCRYDKKTDELIEKVYEASSIYEKRDAVICKIEEKQKNR